MFLFSLIWAACDHIFDEKANFTAGERFKCRAVAAKWSEEHVVGGLETAVAREKHSAFFFFFFPSSCFFDADGLLSFVYPLNAQRSLLISILPTPSVHPLILSRLARASSSTTLLRGPSPLPELFDLFIYLAFTHLHAISKHRSVACWWASVLLENRSVLFLQAGSEKKPAASFALLMTRCCRVFGVRCRIELSENFAVSANPAWAGLNGIALKFCWSLGQDDWGWDH